MSSKPKTIMYLGPYKFNKPLAPKQIHLVFLYLIEPLIGKNNIIMLMGKDNPEVVRDLPGLYSVKLLEKIPDCVGVLRSILAIFIGIIEVRRWNVDVVTCMAGGISLGLDAGIIAKLTGKCSVVRFTGNEIESRIKSGRYRKRIGQVLRYLDRVREWVAANLADAVIVMSPKELQRVSKLMYRKDRLYLCPQGVDLKEFHPDTVYSRQNDCKKVLYCGRKSLEKGYDIVQACAKLLKNRSDELQFVFAGNFEPREIGNCKYLGFVEPSHISDLYRNVDYVVLPSRTEGFPQTIAEAMATGKPCILSRHLFESYLKDGEEVLLCEVDPKNLAEKVTYLLDHPEVAEKIGKQARQYALTYLDKTTWAKTYRDILLGEQHVAPPQWRSIV